METKEIIKKQRERKDKKIKKNKKRKIEYPKTLTNEQKELLEKLQESFGVESTPSEIKFEGMFDKVKKWFS